MSLSPMATPIQMYPYFRLPTGWNAAKTLVGSDGNMLMCYGASPMIASLFDQAGAVLTLPAPNTLGRNGTAFTGFGMSEPVGIGSQEFGVIPLAGQLNRYRIFPNNNGNTLAYTQFCEVSGNNGALPVAMGLRNLGGNWLAEQLQVPLPSVEWGAFFDFGFSSCKMAGVGVSTPASIVNGSLWAVGQQAGAEMAIASAGNVTVIGGTPWAVGVGGNVTAAVGQYAWPAYALPAGSSSAALSNLFYTSMPGINCLISNGYDATTIAQTTGVGTPAAVGLASDVFSYASMTQQTAENTAGGPLNLRSTFSSNPAVMIPSMLSSGLWAVGVTWQGKTSSQGNNPLSPNLPSQWSQPFVAVYNIAAGLSPSLGGGNYFQPTGVVNPGRLNPTLYNNITFPAQNPAALWVTQGGYIAGVYLDSTGAPWVALGGSITTILNSLLNYGRYISTAVSTPASVSNGN